MPNPALQPAPSTLLIFAYSPAGFGHLRVTDALYRGLPAHVTPLLLGSQDESIRFIHRFMSIHPSTRRLMEYLQKGKAEEIFAKLYRWFLHQRTGKLYDQLVTLIEEQYNMPQKILVVATHFGLAHQLAQVKSRLEEDRQIKLNLIVQVTDDSPQHMWFVPEADLIVVPSRRTKLELEAYGRTVTPKVPKIVVSSYPVSPRLAARLSHFDYRRRLAQLDPASTGPIHVAIPISGAAVGMEFFTRVIDALHGQSNRFVFHIVAKITPNTMYFLNQMLSRSYVKLTTSKSDREIVHEYEKLYMRRIIAIEVTKPSEQAFKVLLPPRARGGALLFFCDPVGRQEDDNISFLYRHHLIPAVADRDFLFKKAHSAQALTLSERPLFFEQARHWRGVELPMTFRESAVYIAWMLKEGILREMGRYNSPIMRSSSDRAELSPRGVEDFWSLVSSYLAST